MAYLMKLTAEGAALVAAAQAGGPAVSLTHLAVGDGNGNPVTPPTGNETALVREVYRDQIAAIYVNPSDEQTFVAEMTIPSEEGGWTVHELGIFTADGTLFAYGNYPPVYKPVAEEGSTRELRIRGRMRVASTDVIMLTIDASILIATRDWVLSNITAAALIPGGLTGQHLAKASNADGDFEWVDPLAAVEIVVDVIQEVQTLADEQTVVNFSTVNTNGLAVYIEGVRLVSGTDFTATGAAQITLASSYPGGYTLHAYQNDPLDTAAYLKPELNLGDIDNPHAARTNLGVAGRAKLYFMAQS